MGGDATGKGCTLNSANRKSKRVSEGEEDVIGSRATKPCQLISPGQLTVHYTLRWQPNNLRVIECSTLRNTSHAKHQ